MEAITPWITGPLAERTALAAKNFVVGTDAPLENLMAVAALAIAGAGVLLAVRLSRSDRGVAAAAGLGLAASGLPLVLDLLGADYVVTRTLLIAWLPLAVVVAAGLLSVRLGTAGVVILCALGITGSVSVAVEPAWQRDDWREIAGAVGSPREQRALVVQPATGRTPLGLYADIQPLPPAGAELEEVLAVHPVSGANVLHPAAPPPPTPPSLPGFRVVERRAEETYTLVRLRADRPVRVTRGELTRTVIVPGESWSVVLQDD